MNDRCPRCGNMLVNINKPAGFGVETMQCVGCHAQWLVKPPGPDPKRFMRIGPGVGEVIHQELDISPTPIGHAESDVTPKHPIDELRELLQGMVVCGNTLAMIYGVDDGVEYREKIKKLTALLTDIRDGKVSS